MACSLALLPYTMVLVLCHVQMGQVWALYSEGLRKGPIVAQQMQEYSFLVDVRSTTFNCLPNGYNCMRRG